MPVFGSRSFGSSWRPCVGAARSGHWHPSNACGGVVGRLILFLERRRQSVMCLLPAWTLRLRSPSDRVTLVVLCSGALPESLQIVSSGSSFRKQRGCSNKKPQPERWPSGCGDSFDPLPDEARSRATCCPDYGCSLVGSEPPRVWRFSIRLVSISGVTWPTWPSA